ncbi:MAG: hypothetical protein GEV08_25955, partial [Acidimicrobiia bacterium]|nr:hypothetical protein [Acidimicrobiia bacterium]
MPLLVDVEAVLDGVVLEVGDESGDVDGCQLSGRLRSTTSDRAGCVHGPPAYRPPSAEAASPSGGRPPGSVLGVHDRDLLAACRRAVAAVEARLAEVTDRGLVPGSASQHVSDLAADAAAVEVLDVAGLGVLSEESGAHHLDRGLVAVLDPLDGSTNAHRGVPWYATSICVFDERGPRAAVVRNLASGVTWTATRGGGAWREGRPEPLRASGCAELGRSLVGLSGYPSRHYGWGQFRALGAAALDLCAVAEGALDGYADATAGEHGVWDYAGGWLVCLEAGAVVVDAAGRDLGVLDHTARRAP